MTAPHIIDPAGLLGEALSQASPDLMHSLLQHVINALLSADADTACGAQWGQQDPQRHTGRNGYRHRPLDTRVGAIDVAIPKLRSGTYFPEWLLQRRKRAESALITVVADCYLAGVSTRRMDKFVKTLGITGMSKSEVSRMASDLDEHVEQFRNRPLHDAGPFTFVAADALTMKVREGGRVVSCAVLAATGVNNDGHREVLGVRVSTSETGPAWNEFFADLVARGLTGMRLVTSDAHLGLVEAIAANLPGATWQRCRTHYTANLMPSPPKRYGPPSKRCSTRCTTSPTPHRSTPNTSASWTTSTTSSPPCVITSIKPGQTSSRSRPSPPGYGPRSGPTTPTSASTAKSADAPTPWESSPTARPSSASSEPSSPNKTTNGPKADATSASTSSPNHDSHPNPPNRRTPHSNSAHNPTRRTQNDYTTPQELASNGPAKANNEIIELDRRITRGHLNPTNYISRALVETGEFKPQLRTQARRVASVHICPNSGISNNLRLGRQSHLYTS